MEDLANEPVLQWFLAMAYEPAYVYAAVTSLLILSSFGLPVPEEVTLLSAGFIAYVGRSPELFPAPTPDAAVVDAWLLAGICTLAVFASDVLIYGLGRRFGPSVRNSWLSRKAIAPETWERAERWTERHGGKVCWVFRFTPGVRFPGHLTCGMVKLPFWQFCLADGVATLVSVPTQVLLISFYGHVVIANLKLVKLGIVIVFVLTVAFFVVRKVLRRRRRRRGPAR